MIETILALSIIGWAAFSVGVLGLFGAIYTFKTKHSLSFVWTLVCLAAVGFAFKAQLLGFGTGFTTSVPVPGGAPDTVINWGAIGFFAAKALGVWVVGAAVTSVFYWFSFVRDVKARFMERLEAITERMKNETKFNEWSGRAKSSVAKAVAIGGRNDNVFLATGFSLSLPESVTGRRGYEDVNLLEVDWEPKPVFPEKGAAAKLGALATSALRGTEQVAVDEQAALDAEVVRVTELADTNLTKLEDAVGAVLPPRAKHFKADIAYAASVWPITLISLLIADFLRQLVDLAFTYFRGFLDSVSKMAFGEFSAKA